MITTRAAPESMDVNEFTERAYEQLRRLAGKMLRLYPAVSRWDETDDIWHEAAIRLHESLSSHGPMPREKWFILAGTQIRWLLIDLARKHGGPQSHAANYETAHGLNDVQRQAMLEGVAISECPVSLIEWTEFHEQVDTLPPKLRSVFNLLYYFDLNQRQTAEILQTSERSVRRNWRAARMQLARLRPIN